MIISIAGLPGSGKSTVKKLLAEHLGYKQYSVGDIFAKMAIERGITVGELDKLAMEDPDLIDKQADDRTRHLGQTEDNFIMDGRVAWHFIPQSFKVFLDVDMDVASERIFEARKKHADRDDEPMYASAEEAKLVNEERMMVDDARYLKHYGISYLDRKNYDLVIDTTNTPANEVAERILAALPRS